MALVAAWSLALLPTLAQALAQVGGTHWVQVCTAQGARWVGLEEGSPRELQTSTPVCTWCSSTVFSLPTLSSQVLPASPSGVAARLPTTEHIPARLAWWRGAPPRGPPAG